MADPIELLGATIGGATVGSLLMRFLGASASRNVSALDRALDELKASIGELTREIRGLRDTDIRQAEQIGALQQGHKALQERVDGQGAHWRETFERFSQENLMRRRK